MSSQQCRFLMRFRLQRFREVERLRSSNNCKSSKHSLRLPLERKLTETIKINDMQNVGIFNLLRVETSTIIKLNVDK